MPITRRKFIALTSALPFAITNLSWASSSSIPVGLEMYSVRDELAKDPEGTVRAVAAMGYAGLEFYAPYFDWSEAQTKQMRKVLDELGIRCFSTHNDVKYLAPENLSKARDRNLILGSRYVVQAYSEPKGGLDHWKSVADGLNAAAETLESAGVKVGYHNHDAEFRAVDGVRPMEFLAKNTEPSVVLQLDVGTCLEAGADPEAWIKANPGRIRSLHLKDWSANPEVGFKVLFGEGAADWKRILAAAESAGGAEYYLMEQEGSRYSQLETARLCLESYKKTGRDSSLRKRIS
jgi:sugar phosphate isomerase/epimerase